ncbi:MAG: hypothetical protein ACUVUU_04755 [bacterium]
MKASRLGLLFVVPLILLAKEALSFPEKLDLTGDVRLRLRFVDSKYQGELLGTYGEKVTRGFSGLHRLLFVISYPLNKEMQVGGLVRVSNEDKRVIKSGPDYLSSEFGSGFFEYQTVYFSARVGYFPISFTPLTLMRWDLKDDPEGGGGVCPVCGGPGVGGTLLGETLEELGPKLGFEGFRIMVSPNESISLESYFARCSIQGEGYPVKDFGAQLGLRRYLRSAGGLAGIDLTVVRSWDDHQSAEPDTSDPLNHIRQFKNTIYSVSWHIPLPWKIPALRSISLAGEWSLTKSMGKERWSSWDMDGEGGILSLQIEPAKKLLLDVSYIYLSPHWDSYFRSLSYNPDRRGPRFRVEYEGGNLAFAVFAKYLETIDIDDGNYKAYPTLSGRFYYRATPALDLGFSAIFSGEGRVKKRPDVTFENKRTTIVGSVSFKITGDSSINFEQRYVRHDELYEDYAVSLTTLFVKAKIW